MYFYEDRIRTVRLHIKLGAHLGSTIQQLGYPTKIHSKAGVNNTSRIAIYG